MLPEPTDFCRVFLFRHPELDAAHQNLAVGAGSAPLSRRGRAQLLQWREWLDGFAVHEVHASTQDHCQQAAQALAEKWGLTPIADARLRDQEMGSWQGRAWQEVAQDQGEAVSRFFREFGEAKAPGGESLGEAVERVLQWWADTAPRQLAKSIAVVLPGSVLTGFAAALLGMRLSRCVSLQIPHGGLGILDAFQNGVRIAAWNVGVLAD